MANTRTLIKSSFNLIALVCVSLTSLTPSGCLMPPLLPIKNMESDGEVNKVARGVYALAYIPNSALPSASPLFSLWRTKRSLSRSLVRSLIGQRQASSCEAYHQVNHDVSVRGLNPLIYLIPSPNPLSQENQAWKQQLKI